ncbi:hypothetical protein V5799_016992 [Amblyomma americanum]|uniref:Uncharacterized protein n=1 Tax=Amblyomma americanum TaxID=6943 RepID=A0AAQ4F3I6_AMBAM
MVLQLGSDITLNLERSSVLADELLLSTVTGNGHRLEAEGIINSNLRIKPLLERERSSQGLILHSMYEVQEIMEDLEEMPPLASFQVNLRYLDMQNPNISFKLVGVTQSKSDTFLSYVGSTVHAGKTLRGVAQYYQDKNVPGDPDVVYLITKNLHPNCLAESATTDYMVKHKKVPGQMITETEYCSLILKPIGYEKNVYAEKVN